MTGLDLRGKVAVVTGASAGIGAATAVAMARAGMTVVVTARRAERLDALARDHERILARPADVTDDEAVAALAKWVGDELGACHVLVNNAGANFSRSLRGPDDVDGIAQTVDLNLMGTVRCMAAFADLLQRSAPARVINVASVAGKVGAGSPGYTASKFATVGLSEVTGPDWRRRGVTVTQLNPGFIRTEQFPQDGLRRSPLTRWMVSEPETVADAILDAARSGTPERTVPRWYRAVPVFRHVAAPLYWAAMHRGGR